MMPIGYEGKNRTAVNYLKAMYFDRPEWTPFNVGIMPATWMKYREDLEEIVLSHPRAFPYHKKGSVDFDFAHFSNPLYESGEHTDCWGVVWNNIERGLDSQPVGAPLESWDDFEKYTPPDPMKDGMWGPRDWDEVRRRLDGARSHGNIVTGGGLPHGFMYMMLYYLRGFENLMMDIASDDARLPKLIDMVEGYNRAVIERYVELGVEMIGLGEDLGLQNALPVSPAAWRKYIKPSYMRMFEPCRKGDIPIRLHTDGHILEIIPDLIEAGVTLLNPQFRSNGLDGLKETAKGKVALHQDLDRQLFPFASPSGIENHIGLVFEELHLPEGGLMLYAECEPDVSLENIDAICTVLEKVCNPPDIR
jgi:uroporphyrinogen decarboxylase